MQLMSKKTAHSEGTNLGGASQYKESEIFMPFLTLWHPKRTPKLDLPPSDKCARGQLPHQGITAVSIGNICLVWEELARKYQA